MPFEIDRYLESTRFILVDWNLEYCPLFCRTKFAQLCLKG